MATFSNSKFDPMDPTYRNALADRVALEWVGERGLPCIKCKSIMAYIGPMNNVCCRACNKPKQPYHVRLPIVLIENHWADGRVEDRIQKQSAAYGVSVDALRRVNQLPLRNIIASSQECVVVWPPRFQPA